MESTLTFTPPAYSGRLRGKAPLKLVLKKKIGNKSMALKIEAKVKKLSKVKKELLIEGKIKIRDLRLTI